MVTTSNEVLIEASDGILSLTLNRTARKNALTEAMYEDLASALEGVDRDGDVRCVLIQAQGECFTAGSDLAEFAKAGTVPPGVKRFLRALVKVEKPIVAAVQGVAVGIGTTMLLHCDVVCIAEDAKLMAPFVDLALAPEAASSWLLPNRIGYLQAYSLFALGASISGSEAAAMGLASVAVAASEVKVQAHMYALRLCEKPIGSLRATKRLMRGASQIQAVLESEFLAVGERLVTPEAAEAFLAFQEKRRPNFRAIL